VSLCLACPPQTGSDRRIKEAIEPAGYSASGLPQYTWRYSTSRAVLSFCTAISVPIGILRINENGARKNDGTAALSRRYHAGFGYDTSRRCVGQPSARPVAIRLCLSVTAAVAKQCLSRLSLLLSRSLALSSIARSRVSLNGLTCGALITMPFAAARAATSARWRRTCSSAAAGTPWRSCLAGALLGPRP
jgi:hypothetical protein